MNINKVYQNINEFCLEQSIQPNKLLLLINLINEEIDINDCQIKSLGIHDNNNVILIRQALNLNIEKSTEDLFGSNIIYKNNIYSICAFETVTLDEALEAIAIQTRLFPEKYS